jgi:hypothetical protein
VILTAVASWDMTPSIPVVAANISEDTENKEQAGVSKNVTRLHGVTSQTAVKVK